MSAPTGRLPLTLGPRADGAPYTQIRDGIGQLAASGHLQPGDRLPTVRELAAQLDVAPNTVARAYRELEQAGVIETRGRRGTFLALDADRPRREAFAAACAYVERARELGLDDEDIGALLARAVTRGRSA
jgi:DNA-binding transcriptional regulator YhcF (GntR family)